MKMSWFHGLLVSIGVPVVCAGIAFVAAGLAGSKASASDPADPSSLLGDSSATARPQKTKAVNAKKSSKKGRRPKGYDSSHKKKTDTVDDDSCSDDSQPETDNVEDDILRLAAVQHGHHAKTGSIVKRAPSAEIVFNPIATMASPEKSDAALLAVDQQGPEEGWNRIPTKMEGIVGNLKQRIDSLSKQLHEQEQGRARDKNEFEGLQRKWKEAEHDWRERIKTLVQQISNLENELTGLRANNQYLNEQCVTMSELERRSERLVLVEEHSEELEKQIHHLETLLGDAQAAKDAAINTAIAVRSTLEADLDATHRELSIARNTVQEMRGEVSDMAVARMSLESSRSQLYDQLRSKEAELSALLIQLDRLRDTNAGLELDLHHSKALNEQLLCESEDLQASTADQKYLAEAYTYNNLYIASLMESERKQFEEKSRLVQELVSVKKQLRSMV